MDRNEDHAVEQEQEQDNSIFEELYEGGAGEETEAADGEPAPEEDNGEEIKQENKKALPRFLLVLLGSLVVGVLVGEGMLWLSSGNFAYTLANLAVIFTNNVAGWGLIALPVVELVVCLSMYSGAKRRLEKWDGEDEEAEGRIEASLSKCMWISGILLILSFFLMTAMVSGFASAEAPWRIGKGLFFGGIAAFFVTLLISVVIQQNLVDAQKRMSPEKKGSVFDTKFQKKWYESCDEAERAVIGQCAYQAYKAMGSACMILWMVFTLGAMLFDWGFLPAMGVCVIWGVGQSVYCYSCFKLSGGGKDRKDEEAKDK